MVKAPKYVHDASDDILWQPERFQEGSMIAWAYCICDGCDRCDADVGMRWKGYGNWKTLIFWRGKLGGMGGTKSCGCWEHQRTSENVWDEILHNSHTISVTSAQSLITLFSPCLACSTIISAILLLVHLLFSVISIETLHTNQLSVTGHHMGLFVCFECFMHPLGLP